MERKELKKWLDEIAEVYEKLHDLSAQNDNMLSVGYPNVGVHVYSGIENIANTMNLDITEVERNDADYPYCYEVVYKGVRIFQLKEERLGEYGLSD